MCLNIKCYKSGRCDFCDARCPYYVDDDDFLNFAEESGIIELFHDKAIRKIESGMKQETSD